MAVVSYESVDYYAHVAARPQELHNPGAFARHFCPA
jgi:hypothetical protein